MDPIGNPYTPNAGSRPQALAGRDQELEQFRVLVGRLKRGATEQSMIIRGLRGVGKTVLLNAFEDRAESEGFLTYYHEMTPDSSLVGEITRDAQAAIARLKLSARATKAMREALAHLGTIKVVGPEGIELSVDLRAADEGTIARDLSELLLQLGRVAAEKGTGVVFLLDEVQFVKEVEYRSVITALHRATQKNVPITLAAAGLPQIPRLTGEARSYAERLFSFPVISSLSASDAAAALVGPARQQQVEYESEAVDLALAWTGGYPFYIQQLGKHAWNLASSSPITMADLEAAMPAAQQTLDSSIYEVRIQRATDQERRYMRAMAELGTGPYKTGDVAGRLGRKTSELSTVRQRLLDKGLVYATEEYGYVDFTVPRFGEFMVRYMPFRPPRRKPPS
ncbi:MAG: ATP-binding protein [Thermoleophilaceae bacterium]|nr:ATP-binding protein [Thermoleophilaceae bacterium]